MPTNTEILRGLSIFADVKSELVESIAALGDFREMPASVVLFSRGEQAKDLHILIEGSVALVRDSGAGSETVVEVLDAPDVFMIAAVLTGAPYLTSARTIQDSRLLYVPADQLRALLQGHPDFAYALLVSLGKQYRLLVRQISDLKLRSTAQRLGCYLLGQARMNGNEFRLSLDKRMLAAKLGASPEHLSRAFATLRAHGVETSGSRVTIADVAQLSSFAQPDDI